MAEFGELAAGAFVPGKNLFYLAGGYPVPAAEEFQEFIDAPILLGIDEESGKFGLLEGVQFLGKILTKCIVVAQFALAVSSLILLNANDAQNAVCKLLATSTCFWLKLLFGPSV